MTTALLVVALDHFLEGPNCTLTKLRCSLAFGSEDDWALPAQQPAIENTTIPASPAPSCRICDLDVVGI